MYYFFCRCGTHHVTCCFCSCFSRFRHFFSPVCRCLSEGRTSEAISGDGNSSEVGGGGAGCRGGRGRLLLVLEDVLEDETRLLTNDTSSSSPTRAAIESLAKLSTGEYSDKSGPAVNFGDHETLRKKVEKTEASQHENKKEARKEAAKSPVVLEISSGVHRQDKGNFETVDDAAHREYTPTISSLEVHGVVLVWTRNHVPRGQTLPAQQSPRGEPLPVPAVEEWTGVHRGAGGSESAISDKMGYGLKEKTEEADIVGDAQQLLNLLLRDGSAAKGKILL